MVLLQCIEVHFMPKISGRCAIEVYALMQYTGICACDIEKNIIIIHIGSTISHSLPTPRSPPRVRITAINSNGLESPNVAEVVRTEAVGPPQTPTISNVTVTDTHIVINWTDPGKSSTMLQFK